jgi:hypothetical protein
MRWSASGPTMIAKIIGGLRAADGEVSQDPQTDLRSGLLDNKADGFVVDDHLETLTPGFGPMTDVLSLLHRNT